MSETVPIACRDLSSCKRFVLIPTDGGGQVILEGALDGWHFTAHTGWLCPEHAPSDQGQAGQ